MYVGPTIAIQMPPAVTLMAVSLVHVILASRAMVGLAQHAAALRLVHNAHKRAHAMSQTLLIATMSLVPARANLDGMGQTVTLISTNVRMECVYVILQQSSVSTRMDHQNVSAYMGQLEVNVFYNLQRLKQLKLPRPLQRTGRQKL